MGWSIAVYNKSWHYTYNWNKVIPIVMQGSLHLDGYSLNRQIETVNEEGSLPSSKTLWNLKHSLTCKINAPKRYGSHWALEYHGSLRGVVVLGVYRPPSSRVFWFQMFSDLILEALVLGPIIIMGDLNADLLKPSTYSSIKDIFPTRITPSSQSCLDIIAIPQSQTCTCYRLSSVAAIDLCPVEATIDETSK